MTIQIVDSKIEEYLRDLLVPEPDDVRREMEAEAEERGFPIVEAHVGITMSLLAHAIGAKRVFEMGSGYGYSAYWFAKAVGPGGEVHMTEGDAGNQEKAMAYLSRAGLDDRVRAHVGNALDIIDEVDGDFDVVFCDIDKGDYPTAWEQAKERIRPGGLYLCDNVLWSGRVAEKKPKDDVAPGWTEAIRSHNEAVVADDRYHASILPIRDGVMVALRVAR